ncbi:MAG: ABC transporter ATP-binding protein [Spirochaetota bacterium]|nr:ABC transporter ATP-binding protein [Spirochaetota bacterium]
MNILSIKDVKISFGGRRVLDNINFECDSNYMVSISGKTGSGKTTLLSILSGLLKPKSGVVHFKGNNIYKWNDFKRSRYRNRQIGLVFQSYNLLSDLSAYKNILYPAILNPSMKNIKQNVDYLIQYLNLEEIVHQYPATLSGGEKQRVSIARAIINNPEVIIADEPTGNLDEKTGKMVFALFRDIIEKRGILIIIATHNRFIVRNSDSHYHLENGKLILKKA